MKQFKIATTIGSRETPDNIQQEMIRLGQYFKAQGVRARSGHADGADFAFEQGAQEATDVFIPWKGFNSVKPYLGFVYILDQTPAGKLYKPGLEALVKKFHPAPERLSAGANKLMQRNCLQVLGPELDKPSDVVIAYTKEGKLLGGTAFAMRIAASKNIPIINMFNYPTADAVLEQLKKLNLIEG